MCDDGGVVGACGATAFIVIAGLVLLVVVQRGPWATQEAARRRGRGKKDRNLSESGAVIGCVLPAGALLAPTL
ncbi:MAG: hypothetical protein CSA65_04220 [Proteobacteria bacterium]|nr:MAG: hypothetical protein CSA65_04220 [Pseudomonadota bacterium]